RRSPPTARSPTSWGPGATATSWPRGPTRRGPSSCSGGGRRARWSTCAPPTGAGSRRTPPGTPPHPRSVARQELEGHRAQVGDVVAVTADHGEGRHRERSLVGQLRLAHRAPLRSAHALGDRPPTVAPLEVVDVAPARDRERHVFVGVATEEVVVALHVG